MCGCVCVQTVGGAATIRNKGADVSWVDEQVCGMFYAPSIYAREGRRDPCILDLKPNNGHASQAAIDAFKAVKDDKDETNWLLLGKWPNTIVLHGCAERNALISQGTNLPRKSKS